jgi:uncharacterized protein YidB (DUF937 family)
MGNVLTALLPVVLGMLANRQGGPQAGFGPGGGGGLGSILGGMLGGGGGAGAAMGGLGGLGALLEQFQRAGYGEQANSWVSTGQNLPISPDVIGQIFGGGTLSQIAQQAGVTEEQASQGLSELLPEVVNHVTPGGTVPDLDSLTASVEALRQRLGA